MIIPFAAQNYAASEPCDHHWESRRTDYEYFNAKQHKKVETFYCSDCYEEKKIETPENHSWELRVENYNEISATQHSCDKEYRCSKCEEYKTDTVKEAHKWVLNLKYDYNYETKSISAEQHSYTSHYYCDGCSADKYPSATEKHNFDEYGICRTCNYYRTSTVTLKSNSTVNVNENTWMKITAPKKGLVFLYGGGDDTTYIELYNSKKWKFPLEYYKYGKEQIVIPVSKGTYYLKMRYPWCAAIKYVFKADPSKKNYTKKKAVSLKKNKTYTTVIYSGDKKSTWKRYYKIKLTKKQRITILTENEYDYFDEELYNKKGKHIPTSLYCDKNGNWVGFTSNRKLSKGTYYLCISNSWTAVTRKQTTGNYYSFKWR